MNKIININKQDTRFKNKTIQDIIGIDNDKIKLVKRISLICIITMLLVFSSKIFGATTPTLVTRLDSALDDIQDYLVRIATPAAGVAICVGVLMRKFSFGDEEKMRTGKRVIFNAIICYGIILSVDLIIKFVESVL